MDMTLKPDSLTHHYLWSIISPI